MSGTNKGKAAAIAEAVQAEYPSGGVLVLIFDESPISGETPSGERLGVIECDGAFRMNRDAIKSASGLEAIHSLGHRIGDASKAIIAEITAELGGTLARSNDTRDK